jgi:hypothetical protein
MEDMTTPESLREKYINGELFAIGDIVIHKPTRSIHEIVDLGSNYLTVINESGNISKKWLDDVVLAESLREDFNDLRRKRSSRNQVAYCGYKTKNFTEDIFEQFKPLLKEFKEDKFQLLSLIKVTDDLIHEMADLSMTNYSKAKMLLDRNAKYLTKLNKISEHTYRSSMVDKISEFELNEGLKVSSMDKQRAAQIICDALGCSATGTPEEMVTAAATAMKSRRFTPEAWKIAGKMFNMATDVGIKWNKNVFSPPTQKAMEIK